MPDDAGIGATPQSRADIESVDQLRDELAGELAEQGLVGF
jgi:hypothetical protein